jgi:hypothetical protein
MKDMLLTKKKVQKPDQRKFLQSHVPSNADGFIKDVIITSEACCICGKRTTSTCSCGEHVHIRCHYLHLVEMCHE